MARARKRSRKKAGLKKVHDVRHLYGTLPGGQTVAVAIEEPGGLLSTDSATLQPAVRRDGTVAEGAPEWVPPTRPTILVVQSIQKDPLGQMYARDQVDRARYLAGRYYQELHSEAEIGNVQAMDPGKPVVDGGCTVEPINEHQHRASKRLRRLDQQLFSEHGQEGLRLTRSVLIEKLTINRLAVQNGRKARTDVDFLRLLFRQCLTELAIDMGYATRSIRNERMVDAAL